MAKPSGKPEAGPGMGVFKGVLSPLNAQVPNRDPRSDVAKNSPMDVSMPADPLDIIDGYGGK